VNGLLKVNRVSVGVQGSFVDGLSKRRVGVDGGVDVVDGGFQGKGEAHFGDEVGGILANDVGSEDFAVFFAEEEFYEAFGLAAGLGFSEGLVREFPDLVFDAFFLEGAFGLSDGSNFRVAIGAAGELLDALDGVAFDEESFDTLHGFEAGGVGEPGRSGDITDGVNAVDGSLIAVVDLNPAAIGESRLLSSGKDGGNANGDEAGLGGDFLGAFVVFDGDGDGGSIILGADDFGAGEAFDAGFVEALGDGVADFIVFDGKEVGHHFDEGHFGAKAVVDVGKLDSDSAAADDDHGLGLLLENHGLLRGNDGGAVEGEAGHGARLGAGGDDDVFSVDDLGRAVLFFDLYFTAPGDGSEALDVVDFVLFEEEFDAAGKLSGNLARAADDLGPIVLEVVEAEAEFSGVMLELVVKVGVFEESLGRDTSPVEAGSAGAFHFDAGDFFTKLAGANRGDVASRASSDDDKIV
jgi:hypothetical protein